MGSMGTWQSLAEQCIKRQQASIPKQWLLPQDSLPDQSQHNVVDVPRSSGMLSEQELHITKQDVLGLQDMYRNGECTVREATIAFLKRAAIGQQLLNFATEFMVDESLERADILDAHCASTGELFGPLHGIPVSVKEHIEMRGRVTHAGFVSRISHVSTEDALVVKQLLQAGAIIHIRTNQPQSLMHLDCDNNITGRTLNALDRRLSTGGSSGGDGSSVGFKASIVGVGTDIGGSVRVPAAFNNCYALRPTAQRNSNLGLYGINAGQESIRGVVGPMAQSLDDLEIFQQALLDQKPWETDTNLVPLPWRQTLTPGKSLTIGIMNDDGIVQPHPPVRRALATAAACLESANIKTVPWQPLDHQHAWDILSALYFPDGGVRYRAEFAATGEPELPLTTWALDFGRGKALGVADNWELNAARERYRREYQAAMRRRGVDVILYPAYPGAGALQGGPRYWNYTAVWNLLDQPALVMPSGIVCDRERDEVDGDFEAWDADDAREWESYDPELFHGFPVALQVVGKRWEDETVTAAAKIIEEAIKTCLSR